MATRLSEDEHLLALTQAVESFAEQAGRAGPDAPVPTCPGWSVRDLLAHQGMVHRWATASLHGLPAPAGEFEAQGQTAADPVAWLQEGAAELLATLRSAPVDVEAPVFLKDPPAPRAFWARRQCHETLMHSIDAQAAVLAGPPAAVAVDPALAADGIDELLTGFLPRRKANVHLPQEAVLAVVAQDADTWWRVVIGPGPVATTRHDGTDAAGDWVVADVAAQLYLRLWHRADVREDPAAWPPGWSAFVVSW